MKTIYEYDTETELMSILEQAKTIASSGTPLIEIKPSTLYFEEYAHKLAKRKK
jgi:hypothetical protein